MLLAVDVGNTNTGIGIFQGDQLQHHWRVVTIRERTVDENMILFKELLEMGGYGFRDVSGFCLSSVVPPLLSSHIELSRRCFEVEPLVVGPGIKTGMSIHVENPREVGADRIVNAVAAIHMIQGPVIVIDFGTAVTFDFVSGAGSFEGGVIAPGLTLSMEALFREASKLPKVELTPPLKVIGKNTVSAMQSGLIYGHAGMVDAMIERFNHEIKKDYPQEPEPEVIATGGLASLVAPQTRHVKHVIEELTLQGLKIIYDKNRQ
ncbi:MAG: type III pantothenate kinase [bacterium]